MSNSIGISVVMPVHNFHSYLLPAIDSVLAQSYDSFELIVVVNGGDNALFEELCSRYESDIVSVFYVSMPGLPNALNFGIERSKYNYVARMDSDDICLSERLSLTADFICRNPTVDVISAEYYKIDDSGCRISNKKYGLKFKSKDFRNKIAYRCVIAHPTVCFKKSSVVECGGYSFGSYSEDYELWIRMARSQKYEFQHMPEPVIEYRVHSIQATNSRNAHKILAYDLSLKLREFIYQGRLLYLIGLSYSLFYFFYRSLVGFFGDFKIKHFSNRI